MPTHTALVSDPDITRLVNFVTKVTAHVDGNPAGFRWLEELVVLRATGAEVSLSPLGALLRHLRHF